MPLATTQAARRILNSLRQTYGGAPRTRAPADAKNFGHLDLAAYQRFREDMEARGYRFLADYEVVDLARGRSSTHARTFLRIALSADGTVACGYCQVRQRPGKRLWLLFNELMDGRGRAAWQEFRQALAIQHNVSASTDFEDGRSVCTTNGEGGGQFTHPPAIEMHPFPRNTPLDTLLAALHARVTALRAEKPDVAPVALSTAEDFFRLQDRAIAQKAAYRKSVGWITRDELLAMANGNQAFADAVHEEIQKLLAAEAAAAQG